jgi:hypothetical protein
METDKTPYPVIIGIPLQFVRLLFAKRKVLCYQGASHTSGMFPQDQNSTSSFVLPDLLNREKSHESQPRNA